MPQRRILQAGHAIPSNCQARSRRSHALCRMMSTNRRVGRPKETGLVVGSHNLMHGGRLEALVPHYLALRQTEGLDLLCLQEDRYVGAGLAGGGDFLFKEAARLAYGFKGGEVSPGAAGPVTHAAIG